MDFPETTIRAYRLDALNKKLRAATTDAERAAAQAQIDAIDEPQETQEGRQWRLSKKRQWEGR